MLKFRIWLTSKLTVGGVMVLIVGGRVVQGMKEGQISGILLMTEFAELMTEFAADTALEATWFAALMLAWVVSAKPDEMDARYFLV